MEATHSDGAGTAVQALEGSPVGVLVWAVQRARNPLQGCVPREGTPPTAATVTLVAGVAPQLANGQAILELGSLMAMGLQGPEQQDRLMAREPEAVMQCL